MPQQRIVNYLFNRSQQVTFRNTFYRPEPTDCGVPQGSRVGPLLFVLYELIINTKRGKTEVTLFGSSKCLCKLNNPPLKRVNNFETINYTKSYKNRGLILNETLNMSEHMKVTMKKARSRVNLLRRIRPLIGANTASLIFKVMILPILKYCPCNKNNNNSNNENNHSIKANENLCPKL